MSRKILRIFSLGICILLLVVTGCLKLEKRSYPQKHYFALEASRNSRASPCAEIGSVLKVRKFRVSPQYETKSFVYREGDFAYESDFYNEFLISPGSMFTEEVRQWLEQSGLFQQVVDFSSYMEATHVLEGAITALYGDYRESRRPRAVLEMQFFLFEDVSARFALVFQNLYRREVLLERVSPVILVKGWNDAFRQIMTEFEKDLRERGLAQGANRTSCAEKGGNSLLLL